MKTKFIKMCETQQKQYLKGEFTPQNSNFKKKEDIKSII